MRALVNRGTWTHAQARAAAMWSDDLTATADRSELRQRAGKRAQEQGMPDVMLAGARARLDAFEAKTDGRGTKWYRTVHAVAHLGETVEGVADRLGIEEVAVLGVLGWPCSTWSASTARPISSWRPAAPCPAAWRSPLVSASTPMHPPISKRACPAKGGAFCVGAGA